MTSPRWLAVSARVERHDKGPTEGIATCEQLTALFGTTGEDAFRCLRDSFDGGEMYGLSGGNGRPWEWHPNMVRWRIDARYDGWVLNLDAFDRPGEPTPYWMEVRGP